MKTLTHYISVVVILLGLAVTGCATDAQDASSSVDMTQERQAVQDAIRAYFDGYEAGEWSQVEPVLTASDDFQFFGTDSAEVSRSTSQFQQQLSYDWQLMDGIEIGEMRNVSLVIDPDGEVTTAMYEARFSGEPEGGGDRFSALVRFAHTLRKEEGAWRLVQGMGTVPTSGESSAEYVEQMQDAAE
jgi:ketosteroid isomerase-like protein